jgi:hypothetical protein
MTENDVEFSEWYIGTYYISFMEQNNLDNRKDIGDFWTIANQVTGNTLYIHFFTIGELPALFKVVNLPFYYSVQIFNVIVGWDK